jgi:hypothetical protein
MATLLRSLFVTFAIAIAWSHSASAGMPSITMADVARVSRTGLTDLARQRVEVVSFFLILLLACTGVIQWVWNGLRRDFPVLPRLSYPRALGVIVLWGLLFVLVLTMISGARELLTPGAWEKKGLTYQLSPPPAAEAEITARVEVLRQLAERLATYARAHRGEFPTIAQVHQEVAEPFWQIPSPTGGRYLYVGGSMGDKASDEEGFVQPMPLAYESDSVGPDRLVLLTDGVIQWMPATELERVLATRRP